MTIDSCGGLIALSFLGNPGVGWAVIYGIVFTCITICYHASSATFLALIPDSFPKSQVGTACGVNSFGNLLGAIIGIALIGAIFKYVGVFGCTSIVAGIYIFIGLGAILLFLPKKALPSDTKEEENGTTEGLVNSSENGPQTTDIEPQKKTIKDKCKSFGMFILQFLKPFKDGDFRNCFIMKFFMQCAIMSIQQYILYYLIDMVGRGNYFFFGWNLETPESAQSLQVGIMMGSGLVSSIVCGILSDFIGRKIIIIFSGITMAISCVLLVIFPIYTAVVFFMIPLGLGVGGFYACETALINDCLPSQEDKAKDLGVYSLSNSLPEMVASPIAGALVQNFNKLQPKLGYYVDYGLVGFLMLCSAFWVLIIKKGNKPSKKKNVEETVETTTETHEIESSAVYQQYNKE